MSKFFKRIWFWLQDFVSKTAPRSLRINVNMNPPRADNESMQGEGKVKKLTDSDFKKPPAKKPTSPNPPLKPPPPPPPPPPPDQATEKRNALIGVLHIASAKGFDPWIPFVQAWHETDGFRKVVGEWNYWGIKKPKSWTGKVHKLMTWEVMRGEKVEIMDEFIDFDTPTEAIRFWINMVSKSKNYRDAYKRRHDHRRFFRYLVDSDSPGEMPWATDPKYQDKVVGLYDRVKRMKDVNDLVSSVV